MSNEEWEGIPEAQEHLKVSGSQCVSGGVGCVDKKLEL